MVDISQPASDGFHGKPSHIHLGDSFNAFPSYSTSGFSSDFFTQADPLSHFTRPFGDLDHAKLADHVDPSTMWLGVSDDINGDDHFVTPDFQPDTFRQHLGQITPPDDLPTAPPASDKAKHQKRRASSSVASSSSSDIRQQDKSRKLSKASTVGEDLNETDLLDGDDKRQVSREKNRVAAAKCRAKKKEHVDELEDSYKTQSALNVALKQTAQALRNELSDLRTQALQHTNCDCHSIQAYNLRKARDLAAESMFGS